MSPSPSPLRSETPCAVCAGQDIETVARKDREGRALHSVLCRQCGLVRVEPLPSAAAMAAFYADHYRQAYKGAHQPKPKHCHRQTLGAIERAEALLPMLRPGMRLLDVGAGAGFFPYVLKRRGILVDGIEPNAGYARFGREQLGVDTLRTGFLHEWQPDTPYDLITIHHVFEHLPEPREALRQLRALLAPTGRVLMEVPNIEATYHAPGHVFHIGHLHWFNPATLQALVRQEGFAVASLRLVPRTAHLAIELRRSDESAGAEEISALLDGNAERVRTLLRRHTWLSHYLGPTPYRRLARKARQYAEERLRVRGQPNGRAICDALCEAWLRDSSD